MGQWYVTTRTQSLIFSQSPFIHHFRPIYLAFLCCLTQLNLQTIPHSYHGPTVIVTNVLHETNSRENLPLAHCLLTGLYLTISTLARWSRFRSGSIEIYTEWNKGPKTKRLSFKTPHKNIWFFQGITQLCTPCLFYEVCEESGAFWAIDWERFTGLKSSHKIKKWMCSFATSWEAKLCTIPQYNQPLVIWESCQPNSRVATEHQN